MLVGYLNGVALAILVGQLPTLVGLDKTAGGLPEQLRGFVEQLGATHGATLAVGTTSVALLVASRRLLPRVPGPLIVAASGIAAVALLGLADDGVAVLGAVPAGLPSLTVPAPTFSEVTMLLPDAAGLVLVSFTSGLLTGESFARRGGYEIDPNQEFWSRSEPATS